LTVSSGNHVPLLLFTQFSFNIVFDPLSLFGLDRIQLSGHSLRRDITIIAPKAIGLNAQVLESPARFYFGRVKILYLGSPLGDPQYSRRTLPITLPSPRDAVARRTAERARCTRAPLSVRR
jgi:hypothetical protein